MGGRQVAEVVIEAFSEAGVLPEDEIDKQRLLKDRRPLTSHSVCSRLEKSVLMGHHPPHDWLSVPDRLNCNSLAGSLAG